MASVATDAAVTSPGWGGERRGRLSAYLCDAVLALAVFAASILPLLGVGDAGCDCPGRPTWAVVAVVGQALPLVWRRRWPFAVSLVVLFCTAAYGIANLPDPVMPFGGLVSLYSVAAYARPLLGFVGGAAAMAAVPIAVLLSRTPSDALDYVNTMLELGAAWVLGYATRTRRNYVAALEGRARELERAAVAEAAVQAAEERAAIAREMHDVLAHAITLMVVQAESGPVAADGGADAVFDSISRTGRQAMIELRRVLDVLRPAGASDLAPQPELGDLNVLVEQSRASGVPTALEVQGDVAGLPRPVGVAAYRIVQESLTNTVRHAAGQSVCVRLTVRATVLEVQVDTEGEEDSATPAPTAGGRGLRGMRERVAALGGSLTAGPRPGGGWRVQATLPLTAQVGYES